MLAACWRDDGAPHAAIRLPSARRRGCSSAPTHSVRCRGRASGRSAWSHVIIASRTSQRRSQAWGALRALTSIRISMVVSFASETCRFTTLPSHKGAALAISTSFSRIAATGARWST